jgi:RimJ/RimL family protein N-acetyltransferase
LVVARASRFRDNVPAMNTQIDTGRLALRRFLADDLEAFYQLGSRPEIIRYAQSEPIASREAAREFMIAAPFRDYATYGYGRFACVWKATGEVIGFSGIKYVPEIGENELGYRFLPEFWGMGLATEAGRASIDFARDDLRLERLVAMVHPENVASARVVTKLGFRVERQLRYSGLKDVDVDLFARAL